MVKYGIATFTMLACVWAIATPDAKGVTATPSPEAEEAVTFTLNSQLTPGMSTTRMFELIDSNLTESNSGGQPYDILVICGEWDFSVKPRRGEYLVITRRFPRGQRALIERTNRDKRGVEDLLADTEAQCERVSLGIGTRWGFEITLDSKGRIESVSAPTKR